MIKIRDPVQPSVSALCVVCKKRNRLHYGVHCAVCAKKRRSAGLAPKSSPIFPGDVPILDIGYDEFLDVASLRSASPPSKPRLGKKSAANWRDRLFPGKWKKHHDDALNEALLTGKLPDGNIATQARMAAFLGFSRQTIVTKLAWRRFPLCNELMQIGGRNSAEKRRENNAEKRRETALARARAIKASRAR